MAVVWGKRQGRGGHLWRSSLVLSVPPVPCRPGAAFLVCCLKKVRSPDTLQPSKDILDKRGTYIFGNAVSKRKVKLWGVF